MTYRHAHRKTGKQQRGVALLLAVIVASLILSVGLSLSVLALKEFSISSTVRDSMLSLYAANSGSECGLYWALQGADYFSPGDARTIYCNGDAETVGGDGSNTYDFSFNQGGSHYSNIHVERQGSGENYTLTVSGNGYNLNPSSDDIHLVGRSVNVQLAQSCTFDPSNADTFGDDAPDSDVFADNPGEDSLQDTLDAQFPPAGTVDIQTNQKKYQIWAPSSNGLVTLKFEPLQYVSGMNNAFGYYINDISNPSSDGDYIRDNKFTPIFKTKVDATYFPDLDVVDWRDDSYTVSFTANKNDGVGFAIQSKFRDFDHDGGAPLFKATEVGLNDSSYITDGDFAVAYDVPAQFTSNGIPEYVLAFEDKLNEPDSVSGDFNDMVVRMSIIGCMTTVSRF